MKIQRGLANGLDSKKRRNFAGSSKLYHRWAMIVFCAMYLLNKIIMVFSSVGTPVSQIIFGALAVVLTYSAVKVETDLKKV